MKNSLFLNAAMQAIETNKEITVDINSEFQQEPIKSNNQSYYPTPMCNMSVGHSSPPVPCLTSSMPFPPAQKQFEFYPCDMKEIKKYSDTNGYLEPQDILLIWAYTLENLAYINLNEQAKLLELIEEAQNKYEISTKLHAVIWKNRETGATGSSYVSFICNFFGIAFQDAVVTLDSVVN